MLVFLGKIWVDRFALCKTFDTMKLWVLWMLPIIHNQEVYSNNGQTNHMSANCN